MAPRLADPRSIPVLAVGTEASSVDFEAVSAWFAKVSRGRFTPRFETVASIDLEALGRFKERGGLGRPPFNSQTLVAEALDRLGADHQRRMAELALALLVVVPEGFRPHSWNLPALRSRGATALVHRYAIIPERAKLGACAHELAHLLLDWPDLELDTGLGNECLMARGALLDDPAPPCAPLRVRAGWLTPSVPDRNQRVGDLDPSETLAIGERLIERRSNPDRLLVLENRPRPLLLRRIELDREALNRPVLAVARFAR